MCGHVCKNGNRNKSNFILSFCFVLIPVLSTISIINDLNCWNSNFVKLLKILHSLSIITLKIIELFLLLLEWLIDWLWFTWRKQQHDDSPAQTCHYRSQLDLMLTECGSCWWFHYDCSHGWWMTSTWRISPSQTSSPSVLSLRWSNGLFVGHL